MPRLPRPRRLTLALCLGVAATAGPAAPAHAVIGGAPTAAGAAPWMVALIDADTGKKTVAAGQFCGATVIAPNLLLTAAHCVSDDDGYKTSASDIKVFTGLVLPLRRGPLLSVKSVAVFPHYSDGAGQTDGDVGLIEMERPFTDRTPLPFARPQDGATIGAGASLHIWGWGNRATGEYENYPRQLEDGPVTRYADATCDDDYGRYFNPAAQLCAGQPDGHVDACQGDSGGPITGTGADGTTVLVGSVSFGEGCGVPGFPTVYTKSYRYRTFIAKGLKAAAADLTAGAGKGRHTAGRHAKRRHAHARHGRRAKAHRHG